MKTKHAMTRQQQRYIPDFIVDVYYKFGTEIYQKHGSCKYILDKKALRKVQTYLGKHIYRAISDELKGEYVVDCDGNTITVGHLYKSIHKH